MDETTQQPQSNIPTPESPPAPQPEPQKPLLTLTDFIKQAEEKAAPAVKEPEPAKEPENPVFDNLDLLDSLAPEVQMRLAKERGFHTGGDKSAYQFLKDGNFKNVLSTKVMLKEMAEEIKRTRQHQEISVSNARKHERESVIAELKARAKAAGEVGDTETVEKVMEAQREFLEKDNREATPPQDMHPVFKDFHERNTWYGKDIPMSQAFDSIFVDLVQQKGINPLIAAKRAEAEFGKYFPDFVKKPEVKAEEPEEKPHKPPINPNAGSPKSVTGGSSGQRTESTLNESGRGALNVMMEAINKSNKYTDADKKRATANAIKNFPQSFFS